MKQNILKIMKDLEKISEEYPSEIETALCLFLRYDASDVKKIFTNNDICTIHNELNKLTSVLNDEVLDVIDCDR